MSKNFFVSKCRAAAIHFLISVVGALLTASVVYLIWHPSPLHISVGVSSIFMMILVVDVCLGPLLTFVVYAKGKSSLRFDLSVIGLCQIAALCYGLFTVAQGRPVFLVFVKDRFDLVRNYEVDQASLAAAKAPFNQITLGSPRLVAAHSPVDPKRRSALLFSSLNGGADLQQLPEMYGDYDAAAKEVIEKLQPIEQLSKFNKPDDPEWIKVQKTLDPKTQGYLPLKASAVDMTMLIDRKSGKVLEILNIRPWDQ
jgi:hypothetical protein